MDKARLFQRLSTEDPPRLLQLLDAAYNEMTYDQRETIFGAYAETLSPVDIDGETLLDEVEVFQGESLAGAYYAPFAINSKNFMHVPEETNEWFGRLGDLLQASSRLTGQGEHEHAVACFTILYELVDAMGRGEEIVFGDEIGSWMIPGDEREYVRAYTTSLAATVAPEEFTMAALQLIRRDSWQSFFTQAYPSAIQAATAEQRAHLEAELRRQNIQTAPGP